VRRGGVVDVVDTIASVDRAEQGAAVADIEDLDLPLRTLLAR
jgi:hypothetical protein